MQSNAISRSAQVQIEELSRQASLDLLAKVRFGRLACARQSQPYITPIHYAYHEGYIYGFTTVGQKVEWMRANPLVCLEADEIKSPQQWASVIVFGRYEELPNSEEWRSTREMAHNLLTQREIWWEPGFAKTIVHGTARQMVPVYYRIHIDSITGQRALPGTEDKHDVLEKVNWLKALLSRL
jgi:nitroimidazol reductase NimA-like FMN-containing flavoprotein (pyridoxamine 5'-phosphate oxidase superfamily)